ncbi:MAG: hypothetical protein ACOZAN_02795 [Patescibacteria group bacterium]
MSHLSPLRVKNYFFSNHQRLSDYTWFHFLSRSWLIIQDRDAKKILDQIFDQEIKDQQTEYQIKTLQHYLKNPLDPVLPERVAYLNKYPDLRPLTRDSLTAIFAQKLWKLDLKQVLKSWQPQQLDQVANRLWLDQPAMLSLATYAINFLTLYYYSFAEDRFANCIDHLYQIIDEAWEKLSQVPGGLQSIAYFVTHIIINDSLFYTRPIPKERRELHLRFLDRLVTEIYPDRITDVSVDCHCEIQTCYLILESISPFMELAKQYVEQHTDPTNQFLIEEHQKSVPFSRIEHQNVLYTVGFGNASTIRIKEDFR